MEQNANKNIDIFFDVLNAARYNMEMLDALHNCSLVVLPEDDRELAVKNLKRGKKLPQRTVIYLGVSKREGSDKYDTFQIKEPSINP